MATFSRIATNQDGLPDPAWTGGALWPTSPKRNGLFQSPSSNGPGSYNPFAVSQQSMKIEGQQFLPIFSDAEINTQDGSEEDLQLPAATWDVKFSDHYASMTLTDTNPSSCYSGATLHRNLEDILAADLTSPKGVDLTGIYVESRAQHLATKEWCPVYVPMT
ncbi:unnamed protein product [Durusdinium trenchii]|uniref:Uncharacterized protein n=2 Tax=Durusdinium trenchii TaxID=1381693 RepID=A0ABP0R120_9DINO